MASAVEAVESTEKRLSSSQRKKRRKSLPGANRTSKQKMNLRRRAQRKRKRKLQK